jgi:hypothetical protein
MNSFYMITIPAKCSIDVPILHICAIFHTFLDQEVHVTSYQVMVNLGGQKTKREISYG